MATAFGLDPYGIQTQALYNADPRTQWARALMAQSADGAPVRSPLQGLAKMLTGALGGYMQRPVFDEYQNRQKAMQDYGQQMLAQLTSDGSMGAAPSGAPMSGGSSGAPGAAGGAPGLAGPGEWYKAAMIDSLLGVPAATEALKGRNAAALKLIAPQPEAVRAAQFAYPNDPQSAQGAVRAEVNKAGSIEGRPGGTIILPNGQMATFPDPSKGVMIVYDANGVPHEMNIPNATNALAATEGAKATAVASAQYPYEIGKQTHEGQVQAGLKEVPTIGPNGERVFNTLSGVAGYNNPLAAPGAPNLPGLAAGPYGAPMPVAPSAPAPGIAPSAVPAPGAPVKPATVALGPQAEAELKSRGENYGAQAKAIEEQAQPAMVMKNRITEIRDTLGPADKPNFEPGFLTPLKEKTGSLLLSLGANQDSALMRELGNVSDMQAFSKVALQMAFDATKDLTNRPAAAEVLLQQKANPNQQLTRAGINKILGFMEGISNWKLDRQQQMQSWLKDPAHGGSLAGFEADFNKNHPIDTYVPTQDEMKGALSDKYTQIGTEKSTGRRVGKRADGTLEYLN